MVEDFSVQLKIFDSRIANWAVRGGGTSVLVLCLRRYSIAHFSSFSSTDILFSQTVYDKDHLIHQILQKTILLLQRINDNSDLNSRLGSLVLNFPEVADIRVTEEHFNFQLSRKTEVYRNALDIAKLILLNFHPDVSKGRNNVLALMFDMNLLWEKFVYMSLKRNLRKGDTVTAQNQKNFWKPKSGYKTTIRPDIVFNRGMDSCVVLDTKWKNIKTSNPSADDLRQLYVYKGYYQSKKVALVYPGEISKIKSGFYYEKLFHSLGEKECAVITQRSFLDISHWQREISRRIYGWIDQ